MPRPDGSTMLLPPRLRRWLPAQPRHWPQTFGVASPGTAKNSHTSRKLKKLN
jgi:hypothetical protein